LVPVVGVEPTQGCPYRILILVAALLKVIHFH
jgi:hypothetical protein